MTIRKIFSVFLFLLIACNENTEEQSDRVIRDIPKNKQGKVSSLFERTLFLRDYLGNLDTLEYGYPDLEIRLWYEYGESDERHILVLKKSPGWQAQLHTTFWVNAEDTNYLANRTIINLKPKNGWDKFIDSLMKLDILTLPDESSVPNLITSYNVGTINVEVASKNKYRFYSYTAPAKKGDRFTEARKMNLIMELIEKELGFKRIEII